MGKFSIEEVGIYDDDVEGFQDGECLSEADGFDAEEQAIYCREECVDKVVRGRKKNVDKAQAGLGLWCE